MIRFSDEQVDSDDFRVKFKRYRERAAQGEAFVVHYRKHPSVVLVEYNAFQKALGQANGLSQAPEIVSASLVKVTPETALPPRQEATADERSTAPIQETDDLETVQAKTGLAQEQLNALGEWFAARRTEENNRSARTGRDTVIEILPYDQADDARLAALHPQQHESRRSDAVAAQRLSNGGTGAIRRAETGLFCHGLPAPQASGPMQAPRPLLRTTPWVFRLPHAHWNRETDGLAREEFLSIPR